VSRKAAAAELAIESLVQRNIPTIPTKELLREAVRIALDHGRSACDCLYVALATQTKKQLITADEQLANALAARFLVK
jgi:predicted nucleic acid-binding protein